MSYPVKWYSSDMEGAPVLSIGNPSEAHTVNKGALVDLLKAVLVTGFGVKSVSSLTYNSTTQKITASIAAGHKYLIDQIIAISGAVESGYNGEYRVVSITATDVVMAADNGTPTAGSATGPISIKIPSLGWAVEYEDTTNKKIIFKRADAKSTAIRLFVDNSSWSGWDNNYGHLAKVRMILNPTSISSFTTIFEARWPCSHDWANSEWQLVGDSLLFYFLPQYSSSQRRGVYVFGDINSIRVGDKYNTILTYYPDLLTNQTNWATIYGSIFTNFMMFRNADHTRIARSHHQLAGAVGCSWRGMNDYIGEGMTYPNPADNGFYVSTEPVPLFDDLSYRGTLPGIVVPYASNSALDKLNLGNLPALPNKLIRLLTTNKGSYADNTDASIKLVGFDIGGPWR